MTDEPGGDVRLDFERAGDQFAVWSYAHADYRCVVDHFHEGHGAVSAEFTFTRFDGSDLLGPVRANLLAPRARTELARILGGRLPGLPWVPLLDTTMTVVMRAWRHVEPPTLVVPKLLGAPPFLLGPFLLRDVPTVFFGDGDVGKSFAVTAMALCCSTGAAILPGAIPCGGGMPVLYCDYEDSREAFDDRCARLLAGADLASPGPLHYLEARMPLPDMVSDLRVQIAHLGIRLLVIDSFGYACGPEPETADAAMRVYRAIRALGPVSCAIITHISKASMLARGPRSPYGSIHVRNSARMSWDVRSAQDDADAGSKTIGFWHDKHNPLRHRLPPVGYSITATDDATRFVPASVPRSPDQLVPTSAASEIMAYIREHRLVTNREIATATGLNEKTIDRTCRRLQDRGLIDQLPRPEGTPRTTPVQWFWTGSETSQAPTEDDASHD